MSASDDLGPYIEIPLTRGAVAWVSPEDHERVAGRKWAVVKPEKGGGYAVHYFREAGRVRAISMHRFLVGALRGSQIDHRNGNGLDNRRGNLRLATGRQNNCNRRIRRNSRTGFKGVHLNRTRLFVAIAVNGWQGYLGRFDTPEAGARAYDTAAQHYHGEFARLNLPLAELPI